MTSSWSAAGYAQAEIKEESGWLGDLNTFEVMPSVFEW
jgi:hypothetical protein